MVVEVYQNVFSDRLLGLSVPEVQTTKQYPTYLQFNDQLSSDRLESLQEVVNVFPRDSFDATAVCSSSEDDDGRSITSSDTTESTQSSNTAYSDFDVPDSSSQGSDYDTPLDHRHGRNAQSYPYRVADASILASLRTRVPGLRDESTKLPSGAQNIVSEDAEGSPSASNHSSDSWSHSSVSSTALKFNRRRSGSHGSASVQPPPLRRDTDISDGFVQQLITFTCKVVTGIWPTSATPPRVCTSFNGAGVLPLETFVYETLRRSRTSYTTLQIALYYLILLKPKLSGLDFTREQPNPQQAGCDQAQHGCRAMQCGRRMFLAALMLASKYIQDRNFSTRGWSKISGLRIVEINGNEREYLKLIGYSLHIKKEVFDNWTKLVLTLSKVCRVQNLSSPLSDCSRNMFPSFRRVVNNDTGTSQPRSLGTASWWNSLIQQMSTDVAQDWDSTEAFIKHFVPLEQMDRLLPTPPTSPDTLRPQPDLGFTGFGTRGPSSLASTPLSEMAASPAPDATIPLRPQPRNLRTPQSTPSITAGRSWTCPQSKLRQQASADSLRQCSRRGWKHANLTSCPPPLCRRSNMRCSSTSNSNPNLHDRPHLFSSSGPSPPTSPPDSSATATNTPMHNTMYRSRSNSICSASTTSPASTAKAQIVHPSPRRVHASPTWLCDGYRAQSPCQSGSDSDSAIPLIECTTLTDSGRKSNNLQRSIDATIQPIYAPGPADLLAVNALMDLKVGSGRSSTTPRPTFPSQEVSRDSTPKASQQRSLPRGHKRTNSTFNTSLQNNVRSLLRHESQEPTSVIDSTNAFESECFSSNPEERGILLPNQQWAQMKRPILNSSSGKRLAVGCASQCRSVSNGAPALASRSLRLDVNDYFTDM